MNEYSVTFYADEEKTDLVTQTYKYDSIFDLVMALDGKHLYHSQLKLITSIILLESKESE
jgi:hypothetical protein